MILDGSGALSLLLVLDKGEAGEKARNTIIKECSRIYNIYTYTPPVDDVGCMKIEDIQKEILPIIEKVKL